MTSRPDFTALDEFDTALLLARALNPGVQAAGAWLASAWSLLRERPEDPRADELSSARGGERMSRLERARWVVSGRGVHGLEFGMRLEPVFEVLEGAHAAGRLRPAVEKVWGRGGGVHSVGVWLGPVPRIGRARASLVMGDIEEGMTDAEECLQYRARSQSGAETDPPASVQLLGLEPPPAWLAAAPDPLLSAYSRSLGSWASTWLGPLSERTVNVALAELEHRKRDAARDFPMALLRGAILQLPPERSTSLLRLRGPAMRRSLAMVHAFVRGDLEEAYAEGVQAFGRRFGARARLDELESAALLIACVDANRRGVPEAWPLLSELVAPARSASKRKTPLTVQILALLLEHEEGLVQASEIVERLEYVVRARGAALLWPATLAAGLVTAWLGICPPPALQLQLERTARAAREVISAPAIPDALEALTTSEPGSGGIVGAYRARPAWQPLVEQIQALAERAAGDRLDPLGEGALPYVLWQLRGASGRSVVGLAAAPRLVTSVRAPLGRHLDVQDLLGAHSDVATTHDRVVATLFRGAFDPHHRGGSGAEAPSDLHALLGLVGHPRVVDADGRPVEVVEGAARLVLEGAGDRVRITVEPRELVDCPIACEWEGEGRLAVVQRDEPTAALLRALASLRGDAVPRETLGQLRPALARLAGHVRIEQRGDIELEARAVEPRTSIDVDLEWRSGILTVEIGVRPLGPDGPRCEPSVGSHTVVAELDGALHSTRRDLGAEAAGVDALLEASPGLGALESAPEGVRYVTGLEASCALLQELIQATSAGLCSLGWPRGQPLRLGREYGAGDFRIQVSAGGHEWLRVEAGLELDEGEVLAWRLLAEHARGSGRFVRLADDRVIALSEALRRRLESLEQLDGGVGRAGVDGDASELSLPQVTLPALTELLGEGGRLELDRDLVERRRAIEAALAARPPVPPELRATLRAYQVEGFRWMARLAAAGLGAVLADDMGLGKTVQTLALLLARQSDGPGLVVCPTSVAGNWCVEGARFAPSLEMVDLGELRPDDRLEALRTLGPGQVGVMSYGVLSRLELDGEAPRLGTVVFDEAHALKNSRASRTRAALRLAAGFRLGLTGTPIENHLGELWSVMNVCVPGLLGTEDWFTQGLARSVEVGSEAAADQLRALIRPFLLRRTKAMVLTELPDRVEATVMVEPTRKERAWYEARRRLAEERVAEATRPSSGLPRGQSRVLMLAEIGRLRRAAVDPRLVDDRAPKGAKVELVVTRATELVEAGHQVLVFTQFLDVIRILADQLGERGVRTLELQGSTPASERGRRLEAFQSGKADVFLMSLKAGGVGVNLTAADYVLHVDPWWNPAVEDQATGRAHRMGQTRPVTVYRFCTRGTIEPKILALHDRKRGLAEDLLEGMGERKRLDLDELRALLTAG